MRVGEGRRGALFALLLTLVASAAAAFDVPPARAHVTDLAGVIADDTEARMESELRRVAKDHNVQLAVLTVPSLDDETVESAAQKVFDAWGMGKKGEDRGALLLVAPRDRKVRLQVGYGLEGDLPDGKVGALIDQHVLPSFKAGDFGGGILNGVHAVMRELKIQPGLGLDPPRPAEYRRRRGRRSLSAFEQMLMLGAFIFVAVMCMVSRTFRNVVMDILWYSAVFGGHGHGHGRRSDHFGSWSGGSGFGGFGGGSSGGGGASRGW